MTTLFKLNLTHSSCLQLVFITISLLVESVLMPLLTLKKNMLQSVKNKTFKKEDWEEYDH